LEEFEEIEKTKAEYEKLCKMYDMIRSNPKERRVLIQVDFVDKAAVGIFSLEDDK
jgi:hypothetical protein